jgi:hypothetical protein
MPASCDDYTISTRPSPAGALVGDDSGALVGGDSCDALVGDDSGAALVGDDSGVDPTGSERSILKDLVSAA